MRSVDGSARGAGYSLVGGRQHCVVHDADGRPAPRAWNCQSPPASFSIGRASAIRQAEVERARPGPARRRPRPCRRDVRRSGGRWIARRPCPRTDRPLCRRWNTPNNLFMYFMLKPTPLSFTKHTSVRAIHAIADLDARLRALARELDGVRDEVHEHLLHEARIDLPGGEVGDHEFDVAARALAAPCRR